MEIDRTFLNQAIEEVYKKSLLEGDEKMQATIRDLIASESFSPIQEKQHLELLKDLEARFQGESYTCYIDGAVDSQTEDVRASAAFVIYLDEEIFYKYKFEIPSEYSMEEEAQKTSSHIAEYQSLVILLRTMRGRVLYPENAKLTIYTDSEILVGQLRAEYRVTNSVQKRLRREAFDLMKCFKDVTVEWVPREENKLANRLAQKMI